MHVDLPWFFLLIAFDLMIGVVFPNLFAHFYVQDPKQAFDTQMRMKGLDFM